MTLQDVANKSDVSAGLLSKIENFRTVPSLPVLLSIAKSLEVDMSELVKDVTTDGSTSDHIIIRGDSRERIDREESLSTFRKITPFLTVFF